MWILTLVQSVAAARRTRTVASSIRRRERYCLVSSSMIRPKVCAVEGERAAGKRNTRQVLHVWRFIPRIKTRDAPILIPLLRPAQDVDRSIDKDMATDFSADINDAQNFSAGIEFEDAMLVPLTQVKMLAVVTEVRAGKLRAGNSLRVPEANLGNEPANVAVILRAFTDGKMKSLAGRDHRPRNAGRFFLFQHRPLVRLDRINSPQIARAHPERVAVPGQRLRCPRWRRQSTLLGDYWQFQNSIGTIPFPPFR